MKELYEQLGISSQVYDFCHEIEKSLKERFEQFDKTAEYNQMIVLLAMQKTASARSASALLPVTATTITAVILWKRFMRIHSTQKHVWCVRRLRVERMPWPLLFLETCVQATKCWHQPESHMILLKR